MAGRAKIMSEDSVDQVFEKAISTIHTLSSQRGYNSLPRPPAHIRIQLYALFKQSTEGDVEKIIPRPHGDPLSTEYSIALKKWDAWKSKEGISKTEAKREYIQLLINTMKSYAMGTIAARELLAELEFLWWQVSAEEKRTLSDENDSVLMINQDGFVDTPSVKLRQEIYEALCEINNNMIETNNDSQILRRESWEPKKKKPGKWGRLVIWLSSIIVRHVLNVIRNVIYHSVIVIAILTAIKHTNQSLPVIVDFNVPHKKEYHYKTTCQSIISQISKFFWTTFKMVNRLGKFGINKVYLQVE